MKDPGYSRFKIKVYELLGEILIDLVFLENNKDVPKKKNYKLSLHMIQQISLPKIYLRSPKSPCKTALCIPLFIALFTIARIEKQSKIPGTGE